jgi:hypothetical protein
MAQVIYWKELTLESHAVDRVGLQRQAPCQWLGTTAGPHVIHLHSLAEASDGEL